MTEPENLEHPPVRPYGEMVLVRMCDVNPTRSASPIFAPESADDYIGKGPLFIMSGKGVAALVLRTGPEVTEVSRGDVVLVDKLMGDPIAELDAPPGRELRMIRESNIVSAFEDSTG